jgi:DNA adenine methylase
MPLIPKHTCYVEPFAGGLAVFLAKPRSQMEVINDINGDLITFYRCVRFHQDPLLTELEFVLNSRKEFYDFRDQPGLTDIQQSARWFFRNKNSFGAVMNSFGVGALGGGASHGSRAARMEAIRALSHRLDRVCIEHIDWQRCVALYDRSSTFFFVDPPYTGCKADVYDEWTNTDVQILRDRLFALKGRWLLTLNDTPAIRAIFSGCEVVPVARARGINNKSGAKVYHELIIRPAQVSSSGKRAVAPRVTSKRSAARKTIVRK